MSNYSRLVSFGSSPLYGTDLPKDSKTFTRLIAESLNVDYTTQARPTSSNSKILRKILTFDFKDDYAFVMWGIPSRFEFKTEHGWINLGDRRKENAEKETQGFAHEWYKATGNLEFTQIATSMKDIILAQNYLNNQNIPYVFTWSDHELITTHTFRSGDIYINSLIRLIDWSKFLLFDGVGFLTWAQQQEFSFLGPHPGAEAHQAAQDYVLSKWKF
jgi:hypothetical protein